MSYYFSRVNKREEFSISNNKKKWEEGADYKNKPLIKQKIRVHLKDTCFFCGKNMSSAAQTLQHNIRLHGYRLPKRKQGYKRPDSKEYEYVREKNAKWNMEELSCPSCWFHCPDNDLEALYQHTRQEHKIIKVEGTKGQGGEEEPASAIIRAHRSLTPNYAYFSPKYSPKPSKTKAAYKKKEQQGKDDYYGPKGYYNKMHGDFQGERESDYDKEEKDYYSSEPQKEQDEFYDEASEDTKKATGEEEEEASTTSNSGINEICQKLEELADLFRSTP